ncbi:hypothetical protein O3M35_005692 [Rhynocoris fuscipes]|uniref:Uncharacterized protein n=1 Tax=Rhynocoris fuscipes TaxID=488301 RepID=A0AAW1DLF3_9HEMI
MNTKLLLIYLFIGTSYVCVAQVIEKGQPVKISNPNYPDYSIDLDKEWNVFTNDPKSKIELYCPDFRLSEASPCEDYLSVDDGNEIRKFCGSQSDLQIIAKGQKMSLKLHVSPRSWAAMNCEARLWYPIIPKEVKLQLRGPVFSLHTPESMPAKFDQRWIFKTDPGLKVALTCNDFRYSPTDPCQNGMEVNDGQNTHVFCGGASGLKVFSVGTELQVKFFTGIWGGGTAKCLVQAVNGPSNYQYENEVSEEIDSSEHGTKPGVKSTTCKCGWTNKPLRRIAHGKETGINEYPWMVAIRESLKPGDEPPPFHFCGGSIITHYHVLSAAHCIYYRMNEELYAVMGEHNIRTTTDTDATQHIRIARKIFPQDYSYDDQNHDITILVLEKPIEFNDKVGPVCLSPEKLNLAYKHVLVTGWGMTHLGRPSDVLMKAYLRVLDLNECADIWGYIFSANENAHKVCTDSRKRDTCSGDSGGPLVTLDKETNRYTQVSLVSFGAGCNVGRPTVHTEVAPFYNWILQVIRDTYPQEMICTKQN